MACGTFHNIFKLGPNWSLFIPVICFDAVAVVALEAVAAVVQSCAVEADVETVPFDAEVLSRPRVNW